MIAPFRVNQRTEAEHLTYKLSLAIHYSHEPSNLKLDTGYPTDPWSNLLE